LIAAANNSDGLTDAFWMPGVELGAKAIGAELPTK
jgi:hypothetical protein